MAKGKLLKFKLKKQKKVKTDSKSLNDNMKEGKLKNNFISFKNLKISNKLLIGFAIIMIIFAITIGVAILNMNIISNSLQQFYDQQYKVSNSCVLARNAISGIENNMLRIMLTRGSTNEYINNVENEVNSLNEAILAIETGFTGDKELVTKFKSIIDESESYKKNILMLAKSQNATGANNILNANYLPLIDEASNVLSEIETSVDNDINEAILKSRKIFTSSVASVIILFVISLAIAIISSILITRGIVKPIKNVEKVAYDMSQGKLNAELVYDSNDELGILAKSIKNTTDTLSQYINNISLTLDKISKGNMQIDFDIDYIGDFEPIKDSIEQISTSLSKSLSSINQSSEQVASGAEQVASGSQALSQGSIQQANAIDSLSVSISDISNKVKINTVSAENASKFSQEVQAEVEKGNVLMKQMVDAMSEIEEASSKISKIIKTIDDLAFQTNILALNAAVEAARAGEAGKGFAVVADEVGSLAGKSAESAENTTELIENTIKAIHKGTKLASETAKALDAIVKGAKQSTVYIDQIVVASNEQLDSIDNVINGVEQISAVVQTNSATAEESAAASQELSSQANMLKHEVAKFKLLDEEVSEA